MSVYLLNESYTYADDVTVSGTGSNPERANDYKWLTHAQDSISQPLITFDLKSAKTVDSLWFYSLGVARYQLAYSQNGSSFRNVFASDQDGDSSGYNYQINFSSISARYWRLSVTQKMTGISIVHFYEVQLMNLLVEFTSGTTDFPIEFTHKRIEPSSDAYLAKSDDSAVAEGLSERGKVQFELGWNYMSKTLRDRLEDLWMGPPKKPIVTVYISPERYPDKLYRSYWNSDFDFNYTTRHKGSGFSGKIEFMEI